MVLIRMSTYSRQDSLVCVYSQKSDFWLNDCIFGMESIGTYGHVIEWKRANLVCNSSDHVPE